MIEDYALLGDCETSALVSRDGSIDWLCLPRFDSGACFAAILGGPEHGRWRIAPTDGSSKVSRRYRPGTLILETEIETSDGAAATVVDFMPPRDGNADLVRLVIGKRGQMQMRMELTIRFDYGISVPWVFRLDDGAVCAVAGPDMLVLRTRVPLHGEGLVTVGDFSVAAREIVSFDLTHAASHISAPRPIDPVAALDETEAFWRDWSGRCAAAGPWNEDVRRSLIVLKALTYAPTGGIVAAPTTSLPEQLGGSRNWDYRFCWLRDSAFTLLAFLDAGYTQEAEVWRDWLLRAAAGSPAQMQIMYGVAGERYLPERELPWLPGYAASRPVRAGNAAADQFQLDVYGEVMDAMFQALRAGLPPHRQAWGVACALIEHVEKVWTTPDEGIWEIRGPRQHFTHSKVMAWVAVDRAIRIAERFGREAPLDRWRRARAAIHADVCKNGFDPDLGSFVQAYGSKQLDASLLLLAVVGFLPATDPRLVGTVKAIEQKLMPDGFVRRYDTAVVDDGLPAGEGAFLACNFWLADNYILQGRRDEARALYERLLALRSDLGLLAEMYDPAAGRQVGNFPQAFSHVALVNTALNLSRAEGPAEQRAH